MSVNGDPGVLLMVRTPRRGEVRRALEPVLGLDGCVALQSALIAGATSWAREVAGGRDGVLHVAHDPPDSARELRPLVGDDAILFPQNGEGIAGRLADAAARVFGRRPGPLMVVWPDVPRMRPEHATATLNDLHAGCDLVLGPVFDGGFYLVGLPGPIPALFKLPEETWRSADAIGMGLTVARDAGLEVGILRAERALHRPADLRAAAVDPTLPEDVARILRRGEVH